jgi:hypothetical protein
LARLLLFVEMATQSEGMTMKTMQLTEKLLAAAAAIVVAGQAWALQVKVTRVPGYYTNAYGGGEFTLWSTDSTWTNHYSPKALVNGGLQTFCLERGERMPEGWVSADLGTAAVLGGYGGGSPDPISIGTAWLYKQFAEGNLPGYDYNPGAGRATSARALQETIWWLEHEQNDPGPTNPFRNLVLNKFDDPSKNYTDVNPNFRILVVNPWVNDPAQGAKQSYVLYLPDGGMTLTLLGGCLLGLGMVRRRI